MSESENKAIVKRLYEEMNRGNLDIITQVYADDVVYHGSQPARGNKAVAALIKGYFEAFPDMKVEVADIMADGDRVVTRNVATGTNTGSLMGQPPTGRKVEVNGLSIMRLAGGRVVEEWEVFEELGMLQQLGVIPAAATA